MAHAKIWVTAFPITHAVIAFATQVLDAVIVTAPIHWHATANMDQ